MKHQLSKLETENNYLSIVSEFATDLLKLSTVDDVVWHTAHNVIAKFGFVDIVIYLLDEKRKILTQAAAFGNKNPSEYQILDPIEIPVGQGVVGRVAKTLTPVVIHNTLDEPEYIVDDQRRLSELTVPMICDGELIGVIDSEHPDANFYNDQHQRGLVAVASIAATKIVQANAFKQLQNTVEKLEKSLMVQDVLFEISELIFSCSTLEKFYQQLHQNIARLTQSKNLFIGLVDNHQQRIKLVYFSDEKDQGHDFEYLPKDSRQLTITGFALQQGKPLLLYKNDIKQLINEKSFILHGTIPTAWLGVPFGEGDQQGIVVTQSYSDNQLLKEEDKQLLSFVAKYIRTAIERANNQSELKFLALHDPLTQLPNRTLFIERVSHALNQVKRGKSSGIAILFLDVDRFKQINDKHGHHIGDRLLKSIGDKIANSLRQVDTLARLSGDEFAILLEDIKNEDEILKTANKVINSVSGSLQVGRFQLNTSVSIGVAACHNGKTKALQLIKQADEAMYQAKLRGRNQVYYQHDQNSSTDSYKIEYDFIKALKNDELLLLLQPIVEISTGSIVAAECLIRWHHPEIGLVPPDIFLPEIERAGYMCKLDLYVVEKALALLKQFQNTLPCKINININISSEGFVSPLFINTLERVNKNNPEILNQLCLEITEQTIVDNVKLAREHIKKLKTMNVRLALDDFGTGYSSLSYLHQFSFDTLKIDRSFMNNTAMEKGNIILQAIVNLAKSLRIKTVGEGVETTEQYQLLQELACDYAQGYLISKPLSVENLVTFINKNH
ncbi:EAL domain-containing protein [Thalassotalea ganghwensis]